MISTVYLRSRQIHKINSLTIEREALLKNSNHEESKVHQIASDLRKVEGKSIFGELGGKSIFE